MYDRVYYYIGGTERGEWREATPGVYPERLDIDTLKADIERAGYVAVKGSSKIGPPEGPPPNPFLNAQA